MKSLEERMAKESFGYRRSPGEKSSAQLDKENPDRMKTLEERREQMVERKRGA